MTKEEFLSEFTGEPREITARISYCHGKGDPAFPVLDGMYKCEARFDAAIDSATGEPIETRGFNWLRWLAPKKLFGFSYLYNFKKGKAYRLLVRQAEPKKDAGFYSYLVERLIDAEVDEPRLYKTENKPRKPVLPDSDVLRSELGEFKLNREFGLYEGTIDYLGEEASVDLGISEDGKADAALERLGEICADLEGFDAKIREIAAEELYELVPDWYDEEMSREKFKAVLSGPCFSVNSDGSAEIMLGCGEVFADQGIIIWLDPEGNSLGADLAG